MLSKELNFRKLIYELWHPPVPILRTQESLGRANLIFKQKIYLGNMLNAVKNFFSFSRLRSFLQHQESHPFRRQPAILLVEDDQLVVMVHTRTLHELGCLVDVASTGEKALEMANKFYNLIVLDIDLPDISGIEVARQISNLYAKNKVRPRMVGVTARIDQNRKQQCFEAGMKAVIIKPARKEILARFVYPWLVSKVVYEKN